MSVSIQECKDNDYFCNSAKNKYFFDTIPIISLEKLLRFGIYLGTREL